MIGNFVKKLTSAVLALIVLSNVAVINNSAEAAKSDTIIYFYDNFEKYELGETALSGYGGSAKGNDWKVVKKNENNKFEMTVCTASDMHLDRTLEKPISGRFVMEMSYILNDYNDVTKLFQFIDTDGKDIPVLMFIPNGNIITYNGTVVSTYELNKEYIISISVDTDAGEVKIYVDREHKLTYQYAIKDILSFRVHIRNVVENSTMYIDNFRLYSGNDILDDESWAELEMKYSEDVGIIMQNAVAMYLNKSNVLLHGKKGYISPEGNVVPYKVNEAVMVPLQFFVDSIGGTFSQKDNSYSVTVGTKTVTFNDNSTYCNINDSKKLLEHKVTKKNGELYVPIKDMCDIFNKYLHIEDNGIIVYSDENMDDVLDWNNNQKIMRSIFESFIFDDISGNEIVDMITTKYPEKKHPRLILTEEKINTIKRELADQNGDSVYKKSFTRLKNYADSYLNISPAVYELRDGIRLLDVCRECSDRMLTCAIMYNLTGEVKYAQRAYAEMEAAADFKDWNPYHFLDVGEMASCMGFAYDWLYNWMNETQRAKVRNAIVSKAIYPLMDDFDDNPRSRSWNWRGELADNWRFVVSGVGCAGLAIADELSGQDLINTERAIAQTLVDIRAALSLFAPMGAYEEGCTYWTYSMKYFSFYMESLKSAAGDDFGYVDVPGMKQTNNYIFAINGPKNTFSYHDTGKNSEYYPSQMFFTAKYFGNINEAAARINKIMSTNAMTADEALCDMLLYDTCLAGAQEEELPLDNYFSVSEISTMRSGWNKDDMYVGFHCDNPMGDGGGHDHMDVGQFVLDSMGENFFLDLGAENYNLQGYSNSYRLRAEGHNTIVLNPDSDYGQKYMGSAKIVRHEFGKNESYAIGDMTDAYDEDSGLVRLQRGVKLDTNRHRVIVQDELRVSKSVDFWWFAHTDAGAQVSADGKTAVLTKNGKKLLATITNGEGASFSVMDAVPLPTSPVVPGQNPNTGVCKLTIHIENCKKLDLSVSFTKLDSEENFDNTYIPLSKWSIEGGCFDTGILDFNKVTTREGLQQYMTSTGLIGMDDDNSAFENANNDTVGTSTIEPIVRSMGTEDSEFGNSVLLTRKSHNPALRLYFSYNGNAPGIITKPIVAEFSMKKCDNDVSVFAYEMRMKDSDSEYMLKFSNDGGVYFLNNRVCSYEVDCWYDVKVYFDFSEGYGKLYLKKHDESAWEKYDEFLCVNYNVELGCERIQLGYTTGNDSKVYIDNLHLYTTEKNMPTLQSYNDDFENGIKAGNNSELINNRKIWLKSENASVGQTLIDGIDGYVMNLSQQSGGTATISREPFATECVPDIRHSISFKLGRGQNAEAKVKLAFADLESDYTPILLQDNNCIINGEIVSDFAVETNELYHFEIIYSAKEKIAKCVVTEKNKSSRVFDISPEHDNDWGLLQKIEFILSSDSITNLYVDNFTWEVLNQDTFVAEYIETDSNITENVPLDESINIYFTNSIKTDITKDDLCVTVKKDGKFVFDEKYSVIVEPYRIIVRFDDLTPSAVYSISIDGIYDIFGNPAGNVEVTFDTADFDIVSTKPQITSDSMITAFVKSPYQRGKEILVFVAEYDNVHALKNIACFKKTVSKMEGETIAVQPDFDIKGKDIKFFIWEDFKTLQPIKIEE